MDGEDTMKDPIFIFSAGWRSGSTLLQRMITASGEVLMWGEAGGALDNFADALVRYEQMLGPGGKRYKYGFGGNGEDQYHQLKAAGHESVHKWVACLNPPLDHFIAGFRALFDATYAKPAAELGYASWGVKEVQSGIDTARFLRQVYPEARFVFLVRNPVDCLTSIKRRDWMGHQGDHEPVTFYAGHWQRLAAEFRGAEFGYRIRYEDLLSSPEAAAGLAKYLDVPLPLDFAQKSRVDWEAHHQHALSYWERRRMLKVAGGEMEQYGYR